MARRPPALHGVRHRRVRVPHDVRAGDCRDHRPPGAPGPRPRRTDPLRHRLQPRSCPAVGPARAAHDDRRLHGVWGAGRARRVPPPGSFRNAHRVGRTGARARVDRRRGRRRGQHARRIRDDRRQLLRRLADRPARSEHRPRTADQRVRARRCARAAHPPRRRARRAAVTTVRPPAHDHGDGDSAAPPAPNDVVDGSRQTVGTGGSL